MSVTEAAPSPVAEEARFCEGCPVAGDAIGRLQQQFQTWTYLVGLSRVGAAGVIADLAGNKSQPVDLPFEGKKYKYGKDFEGLDRQDAPEYWPERTSFGREVDQATILTSIRRCTGPVKYSRFFLFNNVKCPAVETTAKMPRSVRKQILRHADQ